MNKNKLAAGFSRFEFKAGFKDFRWRGMQTEGDPSANPANRPRLIVNGRLEGGAIVPRPGVGTWRSETGTGWSVSSIDDFQMPRPKRLWAVFDGCPGVSSTAGFAVCYLDCEQSPMFQRVAYYSTLTKGLCIAGFGGNLYIGADSKLRRVEVLSQPYGTEAIVLSGSSLDEVIYDFGDLITCLREFDGKLYIGVKHGAGAVNDIWTYDGITFRLDKTGIPPPVCFGVYHAPTGEDAIFVGYEAASNKVSYRPAGDSPGTWTDVSPGAGTVESVQMIEWMDKLWIAGGTSGLWKYDGATLSNALAPATSDMRAVEKYNGDLYYGYTDTAGAGASDDKGKIGKTVDGVNFTAFGELQVYTGLRCLATYAGYLVAGGTYQGTGSFWYADDALAPTWPWSRIIPNASFCGDLNQLVVF